jgi:hypothetical protein
MCGVEEIACAIRASLQFMRPLTLGWGAIKPRHLKDLAPA